MSTKICEICGKDFDAPKLSSKTCSKACSYKLRRLTRNTAHEPQEKNCIDCQLTFSDTSKRKLVDRCKDCVNKKMVESRKQNGTYIRSKEQNEKLSATLKKKYESGWNPNTEEHCKKLSASMKRRWSDGSMAEKTKETSLQKFGVLHHTQRAEYIKMVAKFSFAKRGFREDLGCYFRSSWEANFARYLNFIQKIWLYEPKQFVLSNGRTYTPDFFVPNENVYYEIKGAWVGKAKEKTELVIKEHKINLVIVEKGFYEKISKEYSEKIPNWESVRGETNIV